MAGKKNTVLIVDDEPQLRRLLRITLTSEGYKTEECESGLQAIRLATTIKPNLIILDLGLPDIDGKDVLQSIRQWTQVPVIVCSVRDADHEIIDALHLGADDYVTKPFNIDILLARIATNLRKAITEESRTPVLENGIITMDLIRHEVRVNNEKTFFTPKEYELLRYFMVNRGKMLTHKQLLSEVWGPAHAEDTQYLRVYIRQLREKIETESKQPCYLITEPGIGYRMEVFGEEEKLEETSLLYA